MIDKQTLKKHNLKAVPFSCIREGQTFNLWYDFVDDVLDIEVTRRLIEGKVVWADEDCGEPLQGYKPTDTVYVPVWRPCKC